ncbi:M14 family zinc carboxypeptidase [Asanoa sp. WMMD1127]|uniref:M14 family metallopeptidase n=1 Tax=Asanoa sp. WMMD1127 TaxID=3016107 RepID=UPI002417D233|nr:M14 family metallopeptidase [Asanoa sp. WMMD1127]MDG4821563.1 M14 family zinc carboxypeptidase [Asanoa sp. WMMD1127]
MRSRRWLAAATAATLVAAFAASPARAQAPGQGDRLEVYVGTVTPTQLDELRAAGLDAEEVTVGADGANTKVEAVLSKREADRLADQGVKLGVKKIRGKAASQVLREQAAAGWEAFRPYDAPGGIRDELFATAARYPKLTEVVNFGKTHQGKTMTAVRVTKNAKNVRDGARPATLYMGAQHAREWITVEMTRRLLHYVLDNYGKDPAITALVDKTELWFVPVANPDGYDYTFTPDNRLWRKNLRDNDGDGQITSVDGVDPNRNFDYKWGYDNEGSSPNPTSDTYRGPAPNSEPESRALDSLYRKIRPEFFINYHSAAELLLYGVGWQVSTPSPDDVVQQAMVGDDAHPAVPGYDPDLSAELYTTNGDTDSYLSNRYGGLGFTPEMSTCAAAANSVPDDEWVAEDCVSDFIFPDDEELIQAEFEKNIPFAIATGQSALDPDNPVSAVGRSTPDFVVDKFDVSYGTKQPVAAIIRRALRDVRMHYTVNGGRPRTSGVREWRGGERYGDENDEWYAEMRGTVNSAKKGDRVEVWFTGRKPGTGVVASEHFTYTVSQDIGGEVLVLAAEDVTGLSPAQEGTSAKYADEMQAALTAAGRSSDVYDFDTQGRKAPHHLGVLSHYKAVVWETGDDIIPRAPGQVGGTATKSALETELAVRDYVNEGGKLFLTGKYAMYAQGINGSYYYEPDFPAQPECTDPHDPPCLPLFNDFQQYYLGAYAYIDGSGSDEEGNPQPLAGRSGRFTGFEGTLNAPGSAENQDHTASFLATSSILPEDEFPWFGPSSAPVGWVRPGAPPFDPYEGDYYAFSGRGDEAYKRLGRTVDLTGKTSGELRFFTSYDIETNWDFMFVEAHVVGTDEWTTLPDVNGKTGTDPGDSCAANSPGRLHPQLYHYVTFNATDQPCGNTGTTGAWHAATGSSGGWKEWVADLTPYAGKQVELSITYMTDWGTEGLAVFVDDVRVLADGAEVASTGFETDLGGFTVLGPPEGSGPNVTDWTRTQLGFEEGAVITTRDTVYTGFGFEGMAPAQRDDLVKRALRHLLG